MAEQTIPQVQTSYARAHARALEQKGNKRNMRRALHKADKKHIPLIAKLLIAEAAWKLGAHIITRINEAQIAKQLQDSIAAYIDKAVDEHTYPGTEKDQAALLCLLTIIREAEAQAMRGALAQVHGTLTGDTIIRIAQPDACERCARLMGSYTPPYPDDLFYSHPGCCCSWSTAEKMYMLDQGESPKQDAPQAPKESIQEGSRMNVRRGLVLPTGDILPVDHPRHDEELRRAVARTAAGGAPVRYAGIPVRKTDSVPEFKESHRAVLTELARKAGDITHCGDYGYGFYHPGKQDVWWVAGDSDSAENGYTSSETIRKTLAKVPGVRSVRVEYEAFPDGYKDAKQWQRFSAGRMSESLREEEELTGGHWITISDKQGVSTHLYVTHGESGQGKDGTVIAGPYHLIGANIAHLPAAPDFRHTVSQFAPNGAKDTGSYSEPGERAVFHPFYKDPEGFSSKISPEKARSQFAKARAQESIDRAEKSGKIDSNKASSLSMDLGHDKRSPESILAMLAPKDEVPSQDAAGNAADQEQESHPTPPPNAPTAPPSSTASVLSPIQVVNNRKDALLSAIKKAEGNGSISPETAKKLKNATKGAATLARLKELEGYLPDQGGSIASPPVTPPVAPEPTPPQSAVLPPVLPIKTNNPPAPDAAWDTALASRQAAVSPIALAMASGKINFRQAMALRRDQFLGNMDAAGVDLAIAKVQPGQSTTVMAGIPTVMAGIPTGSGAAAYKLTKSLSSDVFDQADRAKRLITENMAKALSNWGVTENQANSYLDGAGIPGGMRLGNPIVTMASTTVKGWATTSGDGDPCSLATQMAAQDAFGLESSLVEDYGGTDSKKGAQDFFLKHRDVMMKMQYAMYDATQDDFAKRGITHVALCRSVQKVPHAVTAKRLVAAQKENERKSKGSLGVLVTYDVPSGSMKSNPLSSFTTDPQAAMKFGGGSEVTDDNPNVHLYANVPVEHIHSHFRSGLGCLEESEFVVLGVDRPYSITAGTGTYAIEDRLIDIRKNGSARYTESPLKEATGSVLQRIASTIVSLREALSGGHWVTISDDEGVDTHLYISHGSGGNGKSGQVIAGPKHLIGANIAHLPPAPHFRSEHHANGAAVPKGAKEHPSYHEHQFTKRVYGIHGPGVGKEVDNPLEDLTKEQAHAGFAKAHAESKDMAAKAAADAKAKEPPPQPKVDPAKQALHNELASEGKHYAGVDGHDAHMQRLTDLIDNGYVTAGKDVQDRLYDMGRVHQALQDGDVTEKEAHSLTREALSAHDYKAGKIDDALSLAQKKSRQHKYLVKYNNDHNKLSDKINGLLRDAINNGHVASNDDLSERMNAAAGIDQLEKSGRIDPADADLLRDRLHNRIGDPAGNGAFNWDIANFNMNRDDLIDAKVDRDMAPITNYRANELKVKLGDNMRSKAKTAATLTWRSSAGSPLSDKYHEGTLRVAMDEANKAIPRSHKALLKAGGTKFKHRDDTYEKLYGHLPTIPKGSHALGVCRWADGIAPTVELFDGYANKGKTLIHEGGHAIDHLLGVASGEGRVSPGSGTMMSHSADFDVIYNKYKDTPGLWDYMRSNKHEMFAEGYSMYHESPARNALLKQHAPSLHAYMSGINDKIEDMAAKAKTALAKTAA